MLDLRQLVNFKFGIGPFEEGPLHCVPTYLTTLREKVKKQNKTVCYPAVSTQLTMCRRLASDRGHDDGLCQEMCAESLGIIRTRPNNESVI